MVRTECVLTHNVCARADRVATKLGIILSFLPHTSKSDGGKRTRVKRRETLPQIDFFCGLWQAECMRYGWSPPSAHGYLNYFCFYVDLNSMKFFRNLMFLRELIWKYSLGWTLKMYWIRTKIDFCIVTGIVFSCLQDENNSKKDIKKAYFGW